MIKGRGISKVIATGSSGNAVLHNTILVDCGIPKKELEPFIDEISAVFITHRHSDHWNAPSVKMFAKDFIPMYISNSDKRFFYKELGKEFCKEYVTFFNVGDTIDFKNSIIQTRVKTDFLHHDVPNYCLEILIKTLGIDKQTKIFHATDTGSLRGVKIGNKCNYYFIEANYQTWKLDLLAEQSAREGKYNRYSRSKKTHLSKAQADKFYEKHKMYKSRIEYLHKSTSAF